MSSKALSLFADFITATNENQLTGPTDILNEVANRTYLLGRLMKGKGIAKTVRGGKQITERLILTGTTQGDFYLPNQTFVPQIEDVLDKLSFDWRFFHNMWVYTEQELELNETGDQFTQFKSIRDAKRMAVAGETYTKLETALFAVADSVSSTMETGAAGTKPFSLRAFFTEDGLAPTAWTTVAGVNPSSRTLWKNPYATYTSGSESSTLVPAFDTLWRKMDFRSPPPMKDAGFRDTNYDKFMILSDMTGANKYAEITRNYNDRLASLTDVAQGYIDRGSSIGAAYNGIPIQYIAQIDSIAYAAPRWLFLNSDYVFPVFHESRYFKELEPMRSPQQPYTWVVHTDVWYNLICTSRQRGGGFVRPA